MQAQRTVYNQARRLLIQELKQGRRDLLDLFTRIVKWEKETPEEEKGLGAEWYDFGAYPQTLNKLVVAGILRVSYKSASTTAYRAVDVEQLEQAINDALKAFEPVETDEYMEPPSDLFNDIVGYDDVKNLMWRAITSEKPIHILMHGSPSSAKSMFLECLSRLPRSTFILGSGLSRAGLYDVLFDERPRYLILDEIDKVQDTENLAVLLSLMERGYVSETKHGKRRSMTLKCSVFAAANRIDKIPPELKSRFIVLKFREYTPDEFIEVVTYVLNKREGIPEPVAVYIADCILKKLRSKDPRDAIKIARLLREKTKREVDEIIEILRSRR